MHVVLCFSLAVCLYYRLRDAIQDLSNRMGTMGHDLTNVGDALQNLSNTIGAMAV